MKQQEYSDEQKRCGRHHGDTNVPELPNLLGGAGHRQRRGRAGREACYPQLHEVVVCSQDEPNADERQSISPYHLVLPLQTKPQKHRDWEHGDSLEPAQFTWWIAQAEGQKEASAHCDHACPECKLKTVATAPGPDRARLCRGSVVHNGQGDEDNLGGNGPQPKQMAKKARIIIHFLILRHFG